MALLIVFLEAFINVLALALTIAIFARVILAWVPVRLPWGLGEFVWAVTEPILAVSGLHAGYGATEILRGVDLTVGQGEIVAVLGSNGAGKSTLNRTISGVMRAWRGSIRFAEAAEYASHARSLSFDPAIRERWIAVQDSPSG